MDDMKVSLSVPATIYSFGETKSLTENKYVTHAKLKVFYVGKTGDNRVFTKQFSDQLLQTLPGTPVVAYYDKEKDDFVGHNHTQYVFGYVPEQATISYVEELGVTFALTDVLLFTGREDNIGVVANKIIGHSHSLELDPKTVEYTMMRSKEKLIAITFTKGDFIGLSVLGENEQPAFTGSSFFTDDDSELKTFVNSFKEFKREVDLYKSGGPLMNEDNNLPILEIETPIDGVTEAEIIKVEVEIKTGEDCVESPEGTPVEIPSSIMDATIPLDHVEESMAVMPEDAPAEEDPKVDPEVVPEEDPEEPEMVKKDEDTVCITNSENIVEAQIQKGMEDGKEKDKEVGEISNAAALNQAERQELNEYRKKAKFELIDSYNDLSSELKSKYRDTHESYSVEDLDKELAFELVKSQRQIKNYGVRVFAINTDGPKEETLTDIINRLKDK